jgi:manganese-dependent ADP-ribose/CDP-alcohol diphosphatase
MRIRLLLVLVLSLALFGACSETPPAPPTALFQFGLLADVQYADKDDSGSRRYRTAVERLAQCVDEMNAQPIEFAVQLGDIIDGAATPEGSLADLERVMTELERLDVPVHHVLGNHCLEVPREELLPRLAVSLPYRSFARDGWRFLILDSLDVSISGWPVGHARHTQAGNWLATHSGDEHPNARPWNGALGPEQVAWLAAQLEQAAASGEHVVVFSHLPTSGDGADPGAILWNHAEVSALLEASGVVVAFFAGHHHPGGYAQVNGIHHVTLQAMCDSNEGANAYAYVDVWPERLELRGIGDVPSRTLAAPGN